MLPFLAKPATSNPTDKVKTWPVEKKEEDQEEKQSRENNTNSAIDIIKQSRWRKNGSGSKTTRF